MNAPITITLHVDAAEAVRAGHGRAGPAKLHIGATELAALTERQRDALARHVAGEPGWSRPLNRGAPPIGNADIATLARLLDARADSLTPSPWTPPRPQLGCCVDRPYGNGCNQRTCMHLPLVGQTCNDCRHVERCTTIFGQDPNDTTCQFFPRRFSPKQPTAETDER